MSVTSRATVVRRRARRMRLGYFVIAGAAFRADVAHQRHHGEMTWMGLVAVERRARFELRVEDDVHRIGALQEVEADLDMQEPGNHALQRLEALLDRAELRLPRAPLQVVFHFPEHD